MNNEPSRDAESVKYERFGRLRQRSEELLMANQAYDAPIEDAPDTQLRLVALYAPRESTLYRLGYAHVVIERLPEMEEDGVTTPSVVMIAPVDLEGNAMLTYTICDEATDTHGLQPIIMKETGENRAIHGSDFIEHDNEYLPVNDIEDEREVTMQEELELDSLLLACRELATFPPVPGLENKPDF